MIFEFVIFCFIFLNLKTFFECLKFKIKYGDKVVLRYIPLIGVLGLWSYYFLKNGDALYYYRILSK